MTTPADDAAMTFLELWADLHVATHALIESIRGGDPDIMESAANAVVAQLNRGKAVADMVHGNITE